jgi:hypothetical protein
VQQRQAAAAALGKTLNEAHDINAALLRENTRLREGLVAAREAKADMLARLVDREVRLQALLHGE